MSHEVPLDEVNQLRHQVDELKSQLAAINPGPDGENPFAPLAQPEDIPEFHGEFYKPDEFLDWLRVVESTLAFKNVPDHHHVPLVASSLRGQALTWWRQLKARRAHEGKSPIETMPKFVKSMRVAFLPMNYERELYQRLQNLRQGLGSVDKYTDSFYRLLERVDTNNESASQLVSRYIGGLRGSIRNGFKVLDPFTVSEAHQLALEEEKRIKEINLYNAKVVVFGLGTCLCFFTLIKKGWL
ncbi:hypothetical protein CASFOL_040303 [Castilleja foliolosa]|uniref:Retrotransposon gag domain-containing protein n=1 Tax=Castilleja foliolosa TaxID=1961234 RepID=A0ABD3BFM5_9LAMI